MPTDHSLDQHPSAAPAAITTAQFEPLFRSLAPIRYRSPLWYPRLIAKFLFRRTRDRAALSELFQQMASKLLEEYHDDPEAEQIKQSLPQIIDKYVGNVITLHYLQLSGIQMYTMMGKKIMESLAQECSDVLRAQVPGDFVDVGVWKGGSSMIMQAVNQAFGNTHAQTKHIFCLDIYDTMDLRVLDRHDPLEDRLIVSGLEIAREYFNTEGVCTSEQELQNNFTALNIPFEGVSCIKGNLIEPDFPFEQVGPIALLRIDCDFYTATKHTLENLYDKMQPSSTIIFDDYYLKGFGERRAADEFREHIGDQRPLQKFGHSAVWRAIKADEH